MRPRSSRSNIDPETLVSFGEKDVHEKTISTAASSPSYVTNRNNIERLGPKNGYRHFAPNGAVVEMSTRGTVKIKINDEHQQNTIVGSCKRTPNR